MCESSYKRSMNERRNSWSDKNRLSDLIAGEHVLATAGGTRGQ
jgi:hypothetical protein